MPASCIPYLFFLDLIVLITTVNEVVKGKAIPVTGREGP
jgi:hypothetical protein